MPGNSYGGGYAWRKHGTYDVSKMWKETESTETTFIELHRLESNLHPKHWTIAGSGEFVSPMQVLKDPTVSPEDHQRIIHADMTHPILIYHSGQKSEEFDVLDGKHRLANAFMHKSKHIACKIITTHQLNR